MAIQLSPGVQVVEKDFTQIIPSLATTRGAYAGVFKWGPILEPTLVTSENELVSLYGKPNEDNYKSFFTASNFLAYSNNMLVTRVDTGASRNAVAIVTGSVASSTMYNTDGTSVVTPAVNVTSPGTGYTSTPLVSFTDPTAENGVNAEGYAVLTGGAISATVINSAGTNYVVDDIITFPTPTYKTIVNGVSVFNTATAKVSTVSGSGEITEVTIINAGGGYLGVISGTVTSTAGAGANITFTPVASGVGSIVITNPGSGYGKTQVVSAIFDNTGTNGTGAVATANIVTSGVKIRNAVHYTTSFSNGGIVKGEFAAKYAGTTGNGLLVSMCDSSTWDTTIALATVSARKFLEPGEDASELLKVRISGITNAQAASQIDVGSVLRTTTAGSEKKLGEVADVSDDDYYKITLTNSAVSSKIVYNATIKNNAGTIIGVIDGLYKEYDSTNDDYFISTKTFYFRANAGATGFAVGDTLKDVNGVAIGVIAADGRQTSVLVTLTNQSNNEVFDQPVSVEWKYKEFFNRIPGTSSYAASLGGLNDEVHIAIVDADGTITGTAGRVIEKFQALSKAYNGKNAGRNNYYKDVINSSSRWIWWLDHPTESLVDANVAHAAWGSQVEGSNFKSLMQTIERRMSGGVDTTEANATSGSYTSAYSLIADGEVYDVSLIPVGAVDSNTAKWIIENVAEKRKDCVVFVSPALRIGTASSIATQIVADRNLLGSSSYAVMDSTWKYQYDRYNDKYRWVPMNADTAGLCARTDELADPWFSPGGFNRGQVKNAIKVAFNPNEPQRDVLYSAGVNPIVTFPGQGTVLYGDKTMQVKASAFDRINVRRLFIVLEKAISTASKFQLFEFNDPFTRAQFKNIVEPFLRDVQGRRGIIDFRVRCDESNNTPLVIDSNQFVADIYIKPNRSINFITLNFIAAKTGASFEELGV